MKLIHKLFSKIGVSTGGHKNCLRYGCDSYCGYSPSEVIKFNEKNKHK